MDVIFDIDGTLADASHRLHFINKPSSWVGPFKRDWDSFLSDEMVSKDAPIIQTWDVLLSILAMSHEHQMIFITGRRESTRQMTIDWLLDDSCEMRGALRDEVMGGHYGFHLYMRSNTDRRKSHETKRDLLQKARADGFNPQLVFEDRADDTKMWRSEGLLCCQVAEGNY